MSISSIQNRINRVNKELAALSKADAQLAKKEADLVARSNRAQEAARRTRNASIANTKLRALERSMKDLAGVKAKRADNAKKASEKTKNLQRYQKQLAREEERSRKKLAEDEKNRIREREAHERNISDELRSRRRPALPLISEEATGNDEIHDFFISHASEDKEDFVRSLAEALRERGASVWYDEFALKVGDSLRRVIDRGLRNSNYGIVVLSKHFFNKEWPNRELDGLVALETQGQTRILPIWHKISKDEVASYSPTLADKVALNTSLKGVAEIADELMAVLK